MPSARVSALVVWMCAGATAYAAGARPVSAAALLKSARQMIVVTTTDWDAVSGTLQIFERGSDGAWNAAPWARTAPRGAATRGVSIVVGAKGTAWDPGVVPAIAGPIKAEGDGRSPAGVFALGSAFGFSRAADATWLHLPYVEVTATTECVDDPASATYNAIVDRATADVDWKSSEKMREISPDYHWGVVVEYNTRPIVPRRGSCIFLHVGGQGGRGTAGCTAMAEPTLKALMQWLDPARQPMLVHLPVHAYAALRTAWSLPPLPAAR